MDEVGGSMSRLLQALVGVLMQFLAQHEQEVEMQVGWEALIF
jgi:hypothetical protein